MLVVVPVFLHLKLIKYGRLEALVVNIAIKCKLVLWLCSSLHQQNADLYELWTLVVLDSRLRFSHMTLYICTVPGKQSPGRVIEILYIHNWMIKAFSKVHNSWKMTIFLALEGNRMSSACFTDWLFIPVFCVYMCMCVFFFLFFMYHGTRADINECEQVPKPCAYQCFNTPGSFKCVCPPGQHLLGDGKSCAGLERLPHYGTQYSSYNLARYSPVRNNYQPQQHYRQYSHLYSSYSEYRNSRTSLSRTRRTLRKTCPPGSEASHDTRVGKCQPR